MCDYIDLVLILKIGFSKFSFYDLSNQWDCVLIVVKSETLGEGSG